VDNHVLDREIPVNGPPIRPRLVFGLSDDDVDENVT
jgi:hypothetical protein